jgi:hypothetical protein
MPDPWIAVHEALLADVERIVERAVGRFQTELPYYGAVPREELRPGVAGNVTRVLYALRDRRGATPAELEEAGAVGAVRARQRVPVEELLLAFRFAVQELWSHERAVARRLGLADAELLDAAQIAWEWADMAAAASAKRHRQVELELASHDQQQRARVLRALLLGSLASGELRVQAQVYGLLPDRRYFPVRARLPEGMALHRLERALVAAGASPGGGALAAGASPGGGALVAPLDGDVVGVLSRPPRLQLPATVGVGPPAPLAALESSFHVASNLLETAVAFGLVGVFDLDALGLRPAVFNEAVVGERLVQRYLAPLERLGPFGATLRETLRALFEHGMRIEPTAAALYVHPNTLRHRLRRFEDECGADLRRTEDLVAVYWALQRWQLRPPRSAESPARAGLS